MFDHIGVGVTNLNVSKNSSYGGFRRWALLFVMEFPDPQDSGWRKSLLYGSAQEKVSRYRFTSPLWQTIGIN
jgi:hypothetical protein